MLDQATGVARRVRRAAAAAAIAVAVAVGGLAAAAAPASAATVSPTAPASIESQLLTALNADRAQAGLQPLTLASGLVVEAEGWTAYQVANNTLMHDAFLSTGIGWAVPGATVGGEAVAFGSSAGQIHGLFMGSPHHHDLLMGPEFRYVGIGVVQSGGYLWVTERFAG